MHDKRSPNASLMLTHRLRPSLSCKTALAKRLVFAGSHQRLDTLTQCWINLDPTSQRHGCSHSLHIDVRSTHALPPASSL